MRSAFNPTLGRRGAGEIDGCASSSPRVSRQDAAAELAAADLVPTRSARRR